MNNRVTIRVMRKIDGTGWVGVVFVGATPVGRGDVCDGKREARREGKRAAEEMGLLTDGVDAHV
jgi:hypothetical protein